MSAPEEESTRTKRGIADTCAWMLQLDSWTGRHCHCQAGGPGVHGKKKRRRRSEQGTWVWREGHNRDALVDGITST